ncbi:MAG: MBL fold metallo-hydrolase [Deltaproteobacteria bacterium]|nr:MBL fold metallo-hydrolase [Deltaproteobacteria bacterium]
MAWSFTVLGGGQEIGANSYLLKIHGVSLLLDAGLHPKKYGQESLPEYGTITEELEAIFISHAHLDHVGSLPLINRQQPQAPIFATIPTKDIALRMLHNTVTVMNIFREEKGYLEYPFFEHGDLRPLEGEIIGLEFNPGIYASAAAKQVHSERVRLRGNIQARFISSGHILGSAGLLLRQGKRNLYYTGDISVKDQALISGAVLPEGKIDFLILECTYANDPEYYSRNRPKEIESFAGEASRILSAGGCVLIPAFALGKTQELLFILHRLIRRGQIPPVPLYISGLGKNITEIYQEHRRYLRPQASTLSFELFSVLGFLDDLSVESLLRDPCLIVATNGMMVENTPSARLARRMVQEERHGIFFCGYIDPDTLGYRVFHSQPGEALTFSPQEEPVMVKNPNIKRFYLSSHADRYELLEIARIVRPRITVLVHGVKEGMEFLKEELGKESQVFFGEKGKTIPLE